MTTAGTIVASVLGVVMLMAGGTKVANLGPHEQEFVRYDLPTIPPQAARVLVGLLELTATVLLAIGAIASSASVARIGAAIALVLMLGAVGTHIRLRDALGQLAPAAVLAIIAIVVLIVA